MVIIISYMLKVAPGWAPLDIDGLLGSFGVKPSRAIPMFLKGAIGNYEAPSLCITNVACKNKNSLFHIHKTSESRILKNVMGPSSEVSPYNLGLDQHLELCYRKQ